MADFLPGQYVSVVVDVPRLGLQQTRQYSLSDAPDGRTYRISVKRKAAHSHRQLTSHVFYETPCEADVQGRDYDHAGRVDLGRIRDSVLRPDADYYLCGPIPFMRAQLAAPKAFGVDEPRIHHDVFGTDVFDE